MNILAFRSVQCSIKSIYHNRILIISLTETVTLHCIFTYFTLYICLRFSQTLITFLDLVALLSSSFRALSFNFLTLPQCFSTKLQRSEFNKTGNPKYGIPVLPINKQNIKFYLDRPAKWQI